MSANWLRASHGQGVEQTGEISVLNQADGTYLVPFTPEFAGCYTIEVVMNGCKLQNTLSVNVQPSTWTFDPATLEGAISLRGDHLKITQTADRTDFSSIMVSKGFRHGQRHWVVQVRSPQAEFTPYLGVVEKFSMAAIAPFVPISPASGYMWRGFTGEKGRLGVWSAGLRPWPQNCELQLELDCNLHELRIINVLSNEVDTIQDLPDAELLPVFLIAGHQGSSMTLLSTK